MRFRIKSSWIGLLLISVMLLSTFAYAIIQSFGLKNTGQLEVPKSNIIDYKLDPDLANALIQYGATIVTFEHNIRCTNCLSQKSFLESYANEYKNQIFLEEINDGNLTQSIITITSVYGQDKLADASDTAIIGSLCKLMSVPPVTCALQAT